MQRAETLIRLCHLVQILFEKLGDIQKAPLKQMELAGQSSPKGTSQGRHFCIPELFCGEIW